MQPVTVEWLNNLDALKDVPAEQLQWLIDNSEHYILETGGLIFEPGKEINSTYFVISGRLSLYLLQSGKKREMTDFTAGAITGYLPYSRGKVASGYGSAREDSQIMTFPREKMMDMIKNHFELTQALVGVMSNRVREFTTMQQQNEKMMALGKLSAGLAHELNNPASAIVRDSISLKRHLQLQPETLKKLISVEMTDTQIDAINKELIDILSAPDGPRLTLKQRSAMEDELTEWLEDKDVEDFSDLAENFVEAGITPECLEVFLNHVPQKHLSGIFKWMNDMLVTEKMVADIQESSRRIEELVKSVKTFTHMDRANDKQYADIHTGIRNTLTMLGYKMRKCNITLTEDFDEDIPQVKAFIGELNQVWTNLIDNALDAMELKGRGHLIIKTVKDREFVHIHIIDDGGGISPEILTRIFDPFFTTKDMGKGTGMGLEVVQRIIHQHNGSIKVKSEPGHTDFDVCLPIDG